MKRPLPIVIALGLAFPVGCGPGAADEPSPGRETGACVENECLGDLMCLSDLCVDPNATPTGGTDGGATSDGSSGNLDDTGPAPVPQDSVSILVVVDNSGSMGEEQGPMGEALGSLALDLTSAGIDWRIGFTTTDIGNFWCQGTSPEQGNLRLTSCRSRPSEFMFMGAQTIDAFPEACGNPCPEQWEDIEITPTAIDGTPGTAPRPWVENIAGVSNLPAGLPVPQAFSCLAPQGINGCGFEGQLEAMDLALERAATVGDPAEGFVPPGALLAVVIVTDEADCSVNPAWETIFDPDGNRVFWSDQQSPAPTSAVCWNAGVECSNGNCVSVNLDADGIEVPGTNAATDAVLHPTARYAARLSQYDDMLLSIISGVQADGSVLYQDDPSNPEFQNDFGIGAGCVSTAGSAVPPVRMRELAEQFMSNDVPHLASICEPSYGPVFSSLGAAIISRLQ